MANKIGKRFSSPYDRKRADIRAKKIRESDEKKVPEQGFVNIFMDDEREIPESLRRHGQWVLVRSVEDLLSLVDDEKVTSRVREISLDWYMGIYPNGEKAVEGLLKRFDENPQFLPELEVIYFHSSDIDKCRLMHARMESVAESRDFFLCVNPR
jgi:hypothetical protein